MGGGAAMRTASKVAGFGVNGGFRGTTRVPLRDQSATTAARKPSKPVATILSSTKIEDGKPSVLNASQNDKADSVASVPKSWEMGDWEFAGAEELILDSMNPKPRVVFGSVPTLEEAQEATSELKEALEKEYFSSSNAIGCRKSPTFVQECSLPVPLNSSGYPETKARATSDSVVLHPSVPKPVFQAFCLLKESPEVQGVVASLASDKNVWDAVMQNDKVIEFIKSQQTNALFCDMDMDVKQSLADDEVRDDKKSSNNTDNGVDGNDSEGFGNGFKKFIHKVKVKVGEMVSNFSEFFHDIFGVPEAGNISMETNGSTSTANVDKIIGGSFMALAVLVIMVVVFQRG